MSWKIIDIVKNTNDDVQVSVDFDVAGVKKTDALIIVPGDHTMTDEQFFDHVIDACQRANPEAVKDQSTKDAEKAAKKADKISNADDSVTASATGIYKLKNLKDTDV